MSSWRWWSQLVVVLLVGMGCGPVSLSEDLGWNLWLEQGLTKGQPAGPLTVTLQHAGTSASPLRSEVRATFAGATLKTVEHGAPGNPVGHQTGKSARFVLDDVQSAPGRGEALSVLEVADDTESWKVKVQNFWATRSLVLAKPGNVRVGGEVVVRLSPETDRIEAYEVAGERAVIAAWLTNGDRSMRIEGSPVEGNQVHFTVPVDWPAGLAHIELSSLNLRMALSDCPGKVRCWAPLTLRDAVVSLNIVAE